MTYQETIDWMFSQLPMYQRQGKTAFKKDLTNISAFCDVLRTRKINLLLFMLVVLTERDLLPISFQVFCKKLVIKLACIPHLI